MKYRTRSAATVVVCVFMAGGVYALAQARSSVRITISDESGVPHPAACELQAHTAPPLLADAKTDGICEFKEISSGSYQLRVVSVGFRPAEMGVSVSSAQESSQAIVLRVLAASTSIDVTAQTSDAELQNSEYVNRTQLEQQLQLQPSRALIDVVRDQPGWTLEANGVLHPRGSEYEMQYIVDGVPILENRSPAFAPPPSLYDIDEMKIQTGGYPASEGRKLGGVVEVHTADHQPAGFHGAADIDLGSFSTTQLSLNAAIANLTTSLQFDLTGAKTDRFLDPPTLQNFTNYGDTEGADIAFAHEFSPHKRLRFSGQWALSGLEVPNELQQELAGQLQSRKLDDLSAQLWYQQVLSPNWLLDLHVSSRSLGAFLDSNSASTPILPFQNRRLLESYASTAIAGHHGRHDFSFGTDFIRTGLRENFQYTITDPSEFDADMLPVFTFNQSAVGYEGSAYVQDHISAGPFTANAGIRWDYYDLLLERMAWSPRLAVAWKAKPLGVVFSASYDRVFDTPPTENLLLASSPETRQVNPAVLGIPVPPAHANFFEVGAHRGFSNGARVDVSAFRRDFRNYEDDDVFLNTGVSFPISFSSALVEGIEAAIHLPLARRFVLNGNFSNLSGKAQMPVTGGLFLDGGAQLLQSNQVFRISQDQRSSASWNLDVSPAKRFQFVLNGWYGSGMPVELDNGDMYTADPKILQRVNFARDRLRPSLSLGVSGSAQVWKRETHAAEVQLGIDNLTNHLNVIDFAGLFSGTAIGAPRSWHARLRYTF